MHKIENKKIRPIFIILSLCYLAIFCLFYYKYVPLAKSFQIALVPILFAVLVITSINIEWGILFFVFAFPLINNLPYFFGIFGNIPHAPTAAVLFLVFIMGWLVNNSLSYQKLSINHPVIKPLILLSLIMIISGIITFFRYANYFPILSAGIYELIVNINMVRAGGAIMSDVFNLLNYLTSFLFFFILLSAIKSRAFLKKLLIAISISTLIFLLFSLLQKYYLPTLGNMPFWANINQINSTFKDPNSFGACLTSFLSLLLGMFFFSPKRAKLFFLFLIIFALFLFPSSGSRSSFLALIISMGLFLLLSLLKLKVSRKKKIAIASSFLLVAALVIIPISLLSKGSNLTKRLSWSLEILLKSKKDTLNTLSLGKIDLWTIASRMIRDYPLTGVGLGAYIVELPNYGKLMGLPHEATDSAENYFFQIGSELGIIGLLLVFWLFMEIIKQMRKSYIAVSSDDRYKFILIGSLSGLASLFINYLFHSYIGSFEVKYTFWLLTALIFILPRIREGAVINFKLKPSFKWVAVVLAVLFGTLHLWNSTHGLLINNLTKKFEWDQDFSFYEEEKDNRGFNFRWAKKHAGISLENVGNALIIPIVVSHPDVNKKPVKVNIFSANQYFRKRELIKEIVFKANEWRDIEISLKNTPKKRIYLILETNRSWQPLKYLKMPDARTLAVGLGRPWFRYPDELPREKIKAIEKISATNWGERNLIANQGSQIKFRADETNIALRLWIRGQKAFGIGPYIILRLDKNIIGKTMLTEENWIPLIFTPEISKGEHSLSVEFINDFCVPEKGQDRNVFLGDLDIIYLKEK